ncbi:MAG: cold shock domain-containing protein [Bacteroidia bacterium]|nr:cold shock domain-containing protein [Bacteroidia bacterium]NNC84509.1 cold shock domain-containing protein [Bacteroidia bacterium]NNM15146.1 cold shock domain-containing protein [Bacteroidia bacterium]
MGRSQETFNKKEKEKKRAKKRQEKMEKREARKSQPKASLDDMIAYVDEFGNTTSTPPDPALQKKVKLEDIEVSVPKRAKIEMDAVRKGKVDFFNTDKGFGFIIEDETNESYFVHINGCEDEITENDKVSFELEKGLKGMNAVKVKKV